MVLVEAVDSFASGHLSVIPNGSVLTILSGLPAFTGPRWDSDNWTYGMCVGAKFYQIQRLMTMYQAHVPNALHIDRSMC
jgi:hypothetical protein